MSTVGGGGAAAEGGASENLLFRLRVVLDAVVAGSVFCDTGKGIAKPSLLLESMLEICAYSGGGTAE